MQIQAANESVVIQALFELSGITKDAVEGQLKELLNEASRPVILFWDIEDIMRATTFKSTFLEEHILSDDRVKQYERQRGYRGKRVWLSEPTAKVIQHIIMNEWS